MNFKKRSMSPLLAACLGICSQAQAEPQQIETDYYDQQPAFELSAADDGWGWSKGDNNLLADCNDTSDTQLPPSCLPDETIIPDRPEYIRAVTQFDSNNIKIEWSKVQPKAGPALYYSLKRALYNANDILVGGITEVYSGGNTNYQDSIPSGYKAKYYARACQEACRGSNFSSLVTVSGPVYTVQTTPPQLITAPSPFQKLGITSSQDKQTRLTSYTEEEILAKELSMVQAAMGKGYDMLKSEVINSGHCWSEQDNSKLTVAPVYQGRFQMNHSYVNSFKQLSSDFGYQSGATLSATYGNAAASGGYAKDLITRTENIEENTTISGKYTYLQNVFGMKLPTQVGGLEANALSQLKANTQGHKLAFRTTCGDEYVNAVTTGRQVIYTVQIVNSELSKSQRTTKVSNFGAALAGVASGGISNSEVTELSEQYSDYTFDIKVTGVGFDPSSDTDYFNNAAEFMQYLKEFYDETHDNYPYGIVDTDESSYPVPDELQHLPTLAVFYDYTDHQNKLRLWNLFDNHIVNRCGPLGYNVALDGAGKLHDDLVATKFGDVYIPGKSIPTTSKGACETLKDRVSWEATNCSEQTRFGQCISPSDNQCQLKNAQCVEVAEQVPYFTQSHLQGTVDEKSPVPCLKSECSRTASMDLCLPPNQVPNYDIRAITGHSDALIKTQDDSQPRSISTHFHNYENIKSMVHNKPRHVIDGNKICAKLEAKVYGQRLRNRGHYKATNTLNSWLLSRYSILLDD